MVHIPLLMRADTYYSYTLGLRSLSTIQNVYHSLDRDIRLHDARFAGVLTIPEQQGMRENPREGKEGEEGNVRSYTEHGRLDPITWIESMAFGQNTGEFELVHPTIKINATNYFSIHNDNVIIRNNRCRFRVNVVGTDPTAIGAKVGQFFRLGDSPPRLYRIVHIGGAGNNIWHCSPGMLPWGTPGNPAVPDPFVLRFEMTNAEEVLEYLDYETRGPFRIEYIETRKNE